MAINNLPDLSNLVMFNPQPLYDILLQLKNKIQVQELELQELRIKVNELSSES